MTGEGADDFRERHLRHTDFLGAFALIERDQRFLLVQNERTIRGALARTWDLPGGQVEPGETLLEALARELREETGLELAGSPRFLFVQEGLRRRSGRRVHAWRSFFFGVDAAGTPRPGGEILDLRWLHRVELPPLLDAPYHDSFLRWVEQGGSWFTSDWTD